ncbi:MAG: hypothetical protein ACYC2U_06660 [Candidatus Amoebophilus sp.]
MNHIINILTGTPLKVWILLWYFVYTGIKAIKPQTIWLPKLFILPLIITGLSVAGLLKQPNTMQSTMWYSYLASFVLGGLMSWLFFRNTQLIIDRATKSVTLPGGYITLFLLLGIFILNYFWDYMHAIYPTFFTLPVNCFKIASSGLLAGLSMGRAATYTYKFFKIN